MEIFDRLEAYQKDKMQEIIDTSSKAIHGGVVFFGDSIMQYYDIKKYFDKPYYYNCGMEGATSDTLLLLNPYAVNEYAPSKVIILVGTNDLDDIHQFDKLEIAFNLFKLIEIMNKKNPGIECVVVSPLPIDEAKQKQRCRDNNQLRLLGNEFKSNVEESSHALYVDVFDEFLKDQQLNNEYSEDGLHLNEKGYEKLTECLKAYL